tara:strand:+ start:2136 stop:2249 length:114 start_codon:yes stop_codon:yes gene_type:complete
MITHDLIPLALTLYSLIDYQGFATKSMMQLIFRKDVL